MVDLAPSYARNSDRGWCGSAEIDFDTNFRPHFNHFIAGGMFLYAESFKGDLSNWDVRNAKLMGAMFKGASRFNSDLSRWDVSRVENMKNMFSDAEVSYCDFG